MLIFNHLERITIDVSAMKIPMSFRKIDILQIKSLSIGRPHGITEDYVNIIGEIMYPKQTFGPYGYDAENGRVRSYRNPNMVPSNMYPHCSMDFLLSVLSL